MKSFSSSWTVRSFSFFVIFPILALLLFCLSSGAQAVEVKSPSPVNVNEQLDWAEEESEGALDEGTDDSAEDADFKKAQSLGISEIFEIFDTQHSSGLATRSEPSPEFCEEWNPDFSKQKKSKVFSCCKSGGRKKSSSCSPARFRGGNYCREITVEQKEYQQAVESGEIDDVLNFLALEVAQRNEQAFCTVNNGFLVYGKPVIPSEENKIVLRSPDRCTQFGTDPMVAMLEWLGREIAKKWPNQANLVLGDVSAPRGGCLVGKRGRRGHSSHTNGKDADIGFLTLFDTERAPASPSFTQNFNATTNWWMIRKIFENPFACIKAIYLDKKLIRKLAQEAVADPLWPVYQKWIQHVRGHKNHIHVRVGEMPGAAGCASKGVLESLNSDQSAEEDADDLPPEGPEVSDEPEGLPRSISK